MARKAVTELKKELQRVVEALVDDNDDENLEGADYAIQTLCALRDLKSDQEELLHEVKNCYSCVGSINEPPKELKCPISGLLMENPVVLASGQTYDEPFIQKWLSEGHQTCPKTEQFLPHSLLIPNNSIKKMITNWCKFHEIDIPRTIQLNADHEEYYGAKANREYLMQLLERLSSSSVSDHIEAAKELRILTNGFPSFRALFGEIKDAISRLFNPIVIENAYSDPRLHLDLIATTLNVSIHESNKAYIAENRWAVSFLVDSLRNGSIEIRSHAAASMSALSTIESNKHVIGESGAIRPLVNIIEQGNPLAFEDSVSAILSLCSVVDNRERAISEGTVFTAMNKIIEGVHIDEMFQILVLLSSHQRAIEEMEEYGICSVCSVF